MGIWSITVAENPRDIPGAMLGKTTTIPRNSCEQEVKWIERKKEVLTKGRTILGCVVELGEGDSTVAYSHTREDVRTDDNCSQEQL